MSQADPKPKVAAEISQDRQAAGLRLLNEIQQEARACQQLRELRYLTVNRTGALVSYRQAIGFERRGRKVGVTAISGVSDFDPKSEFARLADRVLGTLYAEGKLSETGAVQPTECAEDIARRWQAELPPHALAVPFERDGEVFAGLLLFRDEPWTAGEAELCRWLADAYGHAWLALKPGAVRRARRRRWLRRAVIAGVVLMIAGSLLIPVRQTAVAPARVVARAPFVATAPFDGVVKSVSVEPFSRVRKGQTLFRLDDTVIRSRYEIAVKALEVARAELQRANRRSFADPDSKAQVAILEKRVALRQTEADYQRSLLERTTVRAAGNGIAVFADRNDWIGRPVRVGEKIMEIARPADTVLEIDLPVADAIELKTGARVVMFLDTAPLDPLEAQITRTSYQPLVSDNQLSIYRLRASFRAPGRTTVGPQLGASGTAKVYGQQVSLFFYLFRRPIAELRRMTGL